MYVSVEKGSRLAASVSSGLVLKTVSLAHVSFPLSKLLPEEDMVISVVSNSQAWMFDTL